MSTIKKIPDPISWFNVFQASFEVGSNSRYCTAPASTHHDKRLPSSTRLAYLTGRLVSVKELNKKTPLNVGHLPTSQHVYILREGAPPNVTKTGGSVVHHERKHQL